MTQSNMTAIGGWVLIRPDKRKDVTDSGIIIPSSAVEYGYTCGVVVSASSPYTDHVRNIQRAMPVQAGQRVMYRDFLKDVHHVELDRADHCFIHVDDIVLVFDEVSDA
jgi:co-chaperonin GroES (HSP10)